MAKVLLQMWIDEDLKEKAKEAGLKDKRNLTSFVTKLIDDAVNKKK